MRYFGYMSVDGVEAVIGVPFLNEQYENVKKVFIDNNLTEIEISKTEYDEFDEVGVDYYGV